MSRPFVAGNWKMNTTVTEAKALASHIRDDLRNVGEIEIVLCPPFVSLAEVSNVVENSKIKTGAQNMHYEDKGAFTGEVSAAMLTGLCQYVILGHSERRRDFGESDQLINRKAKKALELGINPIICVGEVLAEREHGREREVVSSSVSQCLADIAFDERLVIAYEPVWAIGTGLAATPAEAQAMCSLIRSLLVERFGNENAPLVPIIYGGSVNVGNVSELARETDIDGGLIGGASLDPEQFSEIVRTIVQTRS
ncbi:MAG: triose-phosphate isomerase [Chloroflexota bacterium]|nr:triose-phosphate isomerase [Chloroflexota bacterium]